MKHLYQHNSDNITQEDISKLETPYVANLSTDKPVYEDGFVCCVMDVSSTANPTRIYGENKSNIETIFIDNIEVGTENSGFTFGTTGRHVVMYKLKDNTKTGESTFNYLFNAREWYLPKTITTIETSAFQFNTGLTHFQMSDSVTELGNTAFHNCYSLQDVSISRNITKIGNHCFRECNNLKRADIGDRCQIIGASAFQNTYKLQYVHIGTGITSIGASAFLDQNSGGHPEEQILVIDKQTVPQIGSNAFIYKNFKVFTLNVGGYSTALGGYGFKIKFNNFYNAIKFTKTNLLFSAPNNPISNEGCFENVPEPSINQDILNQGW